MGWSAFRVEMDLFPKPFSSFMKIAFRTIFHNVPYTVPYTSPTNSLRFQPFWQVEALEAVASALSASSEILIALQGHVSTGLAHRRRECTPTLRTQASHGLACTIEKFYTTPSIRGPSRAKKKTCIGILRLGSALPLPMQC